MNKPWRNAWRAGLLLAVTASIAITASFAADESAVPVWSVGDRWTFNKTDGPTYANQGVLHSTIMFSVKESRDSSYRVEVTRQPTVGTEGGPTIWGISRGLNTYWRDSAQLPWTELRFLNWPLTEGKTWQFQHPQPDGRLFSWSASAKGWDEVTVPAGRFKAMVIAIEGRNADGSYVRRGTLWYAPAVKWKVKEEWLVTGYAAYVAREGLDLQSYELH